MDLTSVRQQNQARKIQKRVFFSGSGALGLGIGLCYDRLVATQLTPDMPPAQAGVTGTTATQNQECRDNVVALPATANRGQFAGVTDNSYAAVTGGQWVTINEPGSVCQVQTDIATVIAVTSITCQVNADPGVFGLGGLAGRGTALALQTTLTASTTSGPGPNVASIDGTATYTFSTKNVNKTGLFANAVAGDILVVYGGATAADGSVPVTPGRYTIATVTDANNGILSSTPQASGTSVISCQVVRGTPTVLAKLFEGPEESGCVDYFTPSSAGTETLDINGYTYICGGGITLAADDTPSLAVNTIVKRRRGFQTLGNITTSEVIITPTTTTALKPDQATTCAGIELGESTEVSCVLEWGGKKWQVTNNNGATLS